MVVVNKIRQNFFITRNIQAELMALLSSCKNTGLLLAPRQPRRFIHRFSGLAEAAWNQNLQLRRTGTGFPAPSSDSLGIAHPDMKSVPPSATVATLLLLLAQQHAGEAFFSPRTQNYRWPETPSSQSSSSSHVVPAPTLTPTPPRRSISVARSTMNNFSNATNAMSSNLAQPSTPTATSASALAAPLPPSTQRPSSPSSASSGGRKGHHSGEDDDSATTSTLGELSFFEPPLFFEHVDFRAWNSLIEDGDENTAEALIFGRIRNEASQLAGSALLGNQVHRMILDQTSLVDSMATILASRLATVDLPQDALRSELRRAMTEGNLGVALCKDLVEMTAKDPAIRSSLLHPYLFMKGFHAVQLQRAAHQMWLQDSFESRCTALALQNSMTCQYGADLHPGAYLGAGLFLDHATGVVIGETAVVGERCTILHGVTLGNSGRKNSDLKRHPTVRVNHDDWDLVRVAMVVAENGQPQKH